MSAWKPILAALVIFAAGMVAGGMFVHMRQSGLAGREAGETPSNYAGSERGPNRPDGSPGFDRGSRRPRVMQRPDGHLQDFHDRMVEHLGLNDEQRAKVEAILADSRGRMKVIADEFWPKTKAEFGRTRDLIRAELTEEQRQKFDAEFKSREGRSRRGRPPAAPPGDEERTRPPDAPPAEDTMPSAPPAPGRREP